MPPRMPPSKPASKIGFGVDFRSGHKESGFDVSESGADPEGPSGEEGVGDASFAPHPLDPRLERVFTVYLIVYQLIRRYRFSRMETA